MQQFVGHHLLISTGPGGLRPRQALSGLRPPPGFRGAASRGAFAAHATLRKTAQPRRPGPLKRFLPCVAAQRDPKRAHLLEELEQSPRDHFHHWWRLKFIEICCNSHASSARKPSQRMHAQLWSLYLTLETLCSSFSLCETPSPTLRSLLLYLRAYT